MAIQYGSGDIQIEETLGEQFAAGLFDSDGGPTSMPEETEGTATGDATVDGISGATAGVVGSADGLATVLGMSSVIIETVGNAAGTSDVLGDSSGIRPTDGAATGTATVLGFSPTTTTGDPVSGTWFLQYQDGPGAPAGSRIFAVCRVAPDFFLAMNASGVSFRSINDGVGWFSSGTLPSALPFTKNFKMLSPTGGVALIFGYDTGGAGRVFRTASGGTSWSALSYSGASSADQGFEFALTNSPGVYLCAGLFPGNVSLLRSADAGLTWAAYTDIDGSGKPFAGLLRLTTGRLITARRESKSTWYSDDAGATWTEVLPPGAFTGSAATVIGWSFAEIREGSTTTCILAVPSLTGNNPLWVLRSVTNGASWNVVNAGITTQTGFTGTAVCAAGNSSAVVGFGSLTPNGNVGWRLSQDNGITWQACTANDAPPDGVWHPTGQLIPGTPFGGLNTIIAAAAHLELGP